MQLNRPTSSWKELVNRRTDVITFSHFDPFKKKTILVTIHDKSMVDLRWLKTFIFILNIKININIGGYFPSTIVSVKSRVPQKCINPNTSTYCFAVITNPAVLSRTSSLGLPHGGYCRCDWGRRIRTQRISFFFFFFVLYSRGK